MSKSFVAKVAPIATKVRIDGGVLFPSVSVAQMLLETGGKIHSWNNLVGYKVGSGKQTDYWKGKSVSTKTWEVYDGVRHDNVTANWRAYDSIEDCLKDQALLFLNNRARYQRVIDAKTPQEQAEMLRACGYATDPDYSKKIMSIHKSYGLAKYDKEAEEDMEKIKELEKKLEAISKENASLKLKVEVLEKNASLTKIPDWAEPSIRALEKVIAADGSGPLINKPEGGSLDFYRLATILHRAGVGK